MEKMISKIRIYKCLASLFFTNILELNEREINKNNQKTVLKSIIIRHFSLTKNY